MKKIDYCRIINIITDILLALLLAVPPLLYGAVEEYVILSIRLITVIILFLLLLKGYLGKNLTWRITVLDIPFFLFISLSLYHTINTIYFYGSFQELLKTLNYIALYYITVNHVRDRKRIKIFTAIMVITGFCLTLYGFNQYYSGLSKMLSPSYVCHNHYAGLMELCIPLSIAFIFTEDKLFGILSGIASAVMAFGLMYSMSRGGWISFAISFIIMVILFICKRENFYSEEKERKILLTNIITWVIVLVALSVPLLVKERAETIFKAEENKFGSEALEFRIPVWENCLKMIEDQNYKGKGLASFTYLYFRYNKEYPEYLMNAAHSDYLQMAIEAGLTGLIAFFIIILIFYITVIRYLIYRGKDLSPFSLELLKKDQLLLIGYTGSITSLILHGAGDFNFQIPANTIYFYIIMALGISTINLRKKSGDIEETSKKKLLILTVFLSLLLSIITFITVCPLLAEYYLKEGKKYERKLLFEKALIKYNLCQKLNPFNPYYYIHSGYISNKMTLLEKKKKEFWIKKSIEYYEKALSIHPYENSIYYYLGNLYIELGDKKKTVYYFNKMVELDPYNPIYLLTYAFYYQTEGESKKALELYEKYLTIKPNDKKVKKVIEEIMKK